MAASQARSLPTSAPKSIKAFGRLLGWEEGPPTRDDQITWKMIIRLSRALDYVHWGAYEDASRLGLDSIVSLRYTLAMMRLLGGTGATRSTDELMATVVAKHPGGPKLVREGLSSESPKARELALQMLPHVPRARTEGPATRSRTRSR